VEELRALGAGGKSCETVDALPKFRADVTGSAAFIAGGARRHLRATLRYECAG
jgi:hypothetical protein